MRTHAESENGLPLPGELLGLLYAAVLFLFFFTLFRALWEPRWRLRGYGLAFLFLAGWGFGHASLNGRPLYQDYQMHFMVTQGMRRRDTLVVDYPLLDKKGAAGAVDPATQQIDFFIRSPETDERNNPTRRVFDHFFAIEVTWK